MARDESPRENATDPPRYRQSSFAPRDATGTRHARPDWEQLPSDPDLKRDLGYRIENWETFRANDEGNSVMFLPSDEELLKTDAFVVADANSVCDVSDRI